MGTELEKIGNALLRRIDESAGHYPARTQGGDGFYSFRYSCTEITTRGGEAYLKRSETRCENGRLVNEEYEGMVDSSMHRRAVDEAQRHFADRIARAMRLFF